MLSDFEFQCSVNIDGLDHFCGLRHFLYTYSVLWSVLVVLLFFNAFDFIYQKKKNIDGLDPLYSPPPIILCYYAILFWFFLNCISVYIFDHSSFA